MLTQIVTNLVNLITQIFIYFYSLNVQAFCQGHAMIDKYYHLESILVVILCYAYLTNKI